MAKRPIPIRDEPLDAVRTLGVHNLLQEQKLIGSLRAVFAFFRKKDIQSLWINPNMASDGSRALFEVEWESICGHMRPLPCDMHIRQLCKPPVSVNAVMQTVHRLKLQLHEKLNHAIQSK